MICFFTLREAFLKGIYICMYIYEVHMPLRNALLVVKKQITVRHSVYLNITMFFCMYSCNVNIVFHKVYDHHKLPARQICCVAARQGNFFVVFLDIYKRVHIRVSIFRTTQYQSCGYWVYKHSRSMKRNIFHSKCVLINHMVEMYRNRTPSESTKCWLQTLNYKLNSNQPTYISYSDSIMTEHST